MVENNLYHNKFIDLKVCVLIPTYNNALTLAKVITDVSAFTSNIIIINDGATDNTPEILTNFKQYEQVSYAKNVGKGWALRQGFQHALQGGYEYAITIDSDGQHFAEDLPKFIDKLEADGSALIIGSRNMEQSSVPGKSSFGHKFSNFWFWIETGIKAPDTQSGYRLYPLLPLKHKIFITKKYEFEIEVIVKAAWAGVTISSVPVTVYYAPKETRISHFRPFEDFSRISVLNTILVIITFAYIKPRDFVKALFRKNTYKEIFTEVFNPADSNLKKSLSIAFGVFMGIVPVWGFQLVLAIFLAFVLKLNRGLVIISANISLPPMIPVLIYLSYKLGAVIQGKDAVNLLFDQNISIETIHLNFMQYLYGSVALSIVAAVFFGVLTFCLTSFFRITPKKANNG